MSRALEFVLAFASLLLLRLWVTRAKLDHIPTIGRSGWLTSYLDVDLFRRDGVQLVRRAHRELQGRTFKIPHMSMWSVVVSDPKLIEEIKNATDEELSSEKAVQEQQYTLGFRDHSYIITRAVRSSLTRNIAARFGDIRDEIINAFSTCLPVEVEREWTPISPAIAMREIVCRISNRLFVGLPLCREPDWLDLNIQFTIDAFQNAENIKKWPDLLKPIAGRYYSSHREAYRRARGHIGATIQERIDSWGEKEAPNDLITWLLENCPAHDRNVDYLLKAILSVNLAAIHTSSNSFAHVIFQLAAHPQFAEPMRQEALQVIEEYGWTKAAMNEMRKIDSFIRESQRLTGIQAFTMRRFVTKPGGYTFSDGTYLPEGTLVQTPAHAIHVDKNLFENPNTFDGFRFSKMRDADKEDSPKHQLVSTNVTNLSWGNGRHACPGRFFAANELKAMLAHVVLNYDLKLRDDAQLCRHFEFNFLIIPTAEEVLWRKKQC